MLRSLLAFLVLTAPTALRAGDVDYERDVRPLLAEKCGACHGALKQEADLRLDAGRLIRAGGASGAAIVPGKASASLLMDRVSSPDPDERMPPEEAGEPLTQAQQELLRRWIDAGADAPGDETIPVGPEEHWAYQRPVRPKLPVGAADQHPVDAFIFERHRTRGLQPAGPADDEVLLRRLHLDLIGLPPTAAERERFLASDDPRKYERTVDELLTRPQYGERWGRHWMDIWRYSDWDGYKNQLRGSQRHIWRWRDWIVESLNANEPFDSMIVQMLAGDELAPADPGVLRATGFLARNYHKSNRNIWLDATVEHTFKAFLATTLNCARCHDHKYDPLPQAEYYALRAVFEPHNVRTDRVPGESDPMRDGLPRAFDADPAAQTWLYVGGNEKVRSETPVAPAVPVIFGTELRIQPVELPLPAVVPGLRGFIEKEELASLQQELAQAQKDLREQPGEPRELAVAAAKARLESVRARWRAERAKHSASDEDLPELARIAAERERAWKVARATYDVARTQEALHNARAKKSTDASAVKQAEKEATTARTELKTARKASTATDSRYTPVGPTYASTSTGRRLALARWITRRDNPLAARVAVNHIWLRHFGAPLVENVFDFGMRTPAPEHLSLLDWLSVEFIESGWDMKHLHRLLVTSRTWQQASVVEEAAAAQNRQVDPDNRLFWRTRTRRLEAEVIRDSLLHVAGNLDLSRGGPDLDYADGETVLRRSLYFRHAYEKQMPMLVLFDAAGPSECYRRSHSIIPQQALVLANSPLAISQSRRLAAQLGGGSSEAQDEAFIRRAFVTVLCREPLPEELTACGAFLKTQSDRLTSADRLTPVKGTAEAEVPAATEPAQRARENLVHVLLNHNDFVTVR